VRAFTVAPVTQRTGLDGWSARWRREHTAQIRYVRTATMPATYDVPEVPSAPTPPCTWARFERQVLEGAR